MDTVQKIEERSIKGEKKKKKRKKAILVNTNSWGKVLNRVGDKAEQNTALANPRITNQKYLE